MKKQGENSRLLPLANRMPLLAMTLQSTTNNLDTSSKVANSRRVTGCAARARRDFNLPARRQGPI